MPRLLPFALVAAFACLTACDTAPTAPRAEISVGATYTATALQFEDAAGDVLYDYLANGADAEVVFESDTAFRARVFVPYEALVASGETDDLVAGEDADLRVTGIYTQTDGALAFVADSAVDSFFDAGGWTIDPDGAAVRYADAEDGRTFVVVLARG